MIRRPMSRYDLVSTEIDEEKIVDLVPSDFIWFENNDDDVDDEFEFESEGGEGEGGKEEQNTTTTKCSARDRKRQLENAFRNSMRSITSPVPMSPTTNNDYRRINFATDEAMVSSSTNDDEMPSLVHENIHIRVVTPERELVKNKKINTDMLQMAFRIAPDRSFGLTLKDTEEGIVVAEIDESISAIWTIPANEIQVGMIILKINGKPCPNTMFEVKREIFNAPIGSILILDATMPKQVSPPTVSSKSSLRPNSQGKVQEYTSLSSLLNNTEQQAQTSDTGGAGSDCSSNINTCTPNKSILKKKSRYVKPINHHHCAWDYTLPDTNTNEKHKLNNANQNNSSPREQVVNGWFDEVWNHVVGKIYNDFAFPWNDNCDEEHYKEDCTNTNQSLPSSSVAVQ